MSRRGRPLYDQERHIQAVMELNSDILGPGKTAPRLILDLLDYDPRHPKSRNLLADPAPQWSEGTTILRRDDYCDCKHSLIRKDSQTCAPGSNDEIPDRETRYVVAAYCKNCNSHFEIVADFTKWEGNQVPCSLSDASNPLHHLRLSNSKFKAQHKEANGGVENKYDLLTEAHHFKCSNPQCPVRVHIKLSPSRLGKKFAKLAPITDVASLYKRGRREMLKEPERFQNDQPSRPGLALGYLRQYLTDAKTAVKGQNKKIAIRNKKFVISFADECDDLLEYLDFKTYEIPAAPGEEPAQFWKLPIITDVNRNFIDDVQTELNVLIHEVYRKDLSDAGQVTYAPLPADKDIRRSLGYLDYPTKSRTIDLSGTLEHPHYQSLGAVDDFTDDLLGWAWDRQRECDPKNKPYYLDCLKGIAEGRKSEELQTKFVMATSSGESGQQDIDDAYKFFGITDPDATEGDDHIMGLYKSRIMSAPRQKEEARSSLLIVGKHRRSQKIQDLANDRNMTFEEALEFLSCSAETDADMIVAQSIAIADDGGDKSKVAAALTVISKHHGGIPLLQEAAASMENADSKLSIAEAYTRLQVPGHDIADETIFHYYSSLSNGASGAPASKDSFKEALRTIALHRESKYLLAKLENPDAEIKTTTTDPVGLENIGNTCYLNSLLQYYYTVKPVREMVINFQNHRMPLDDESIKKKKVGSAPVLKSEIIKGQNFVNELQGLFEHLKTSSTRSVRPTKELAQLTLISSTTEQNFRTRSASITSPTPAHAVINGPFLGPQLPPTPGASKYPPTIQEEDVDMVSELDGKPVDVADDSSETTLVDGDQLPTNSVAGSGSLKTAEQTADVVAASQQHKNDDKLRVNARSEKNEAQMSLGDKASFDEDVVMVNGMDDTGEADKPPPVPPRNKSGLVIKTTETKETVPNNDLWSFGTQQDVTEVIGNVIYRMRCAIKPTGIEDSGEQMDIIRSTFYGSETYYMKKAGVWDKKLDTFLNLSAYPGEHNKTCDIYEALDVTYDEVLVDYDKGKVPQYKSINALPAVVQIHIQRGGYNKLTFQPEKNNSWVEVKETIYLDRYMDAGPDSTVMRRRREAWKIKAQVRSLEARQAELQNPEGGINVADAMIATKDYIGTLQEIEIEGIDIPASLPDALDDQIPVVTAEMEDLATRIKDLKQTLQEQFTDMTKHEYKLQSVFIHRGQAGGGHYWVYIYDFQNDIWREYNDENVQVVHDRRVIFEPSKQGEATPYYLVYVRSSEVDKLVDAVCRDVQEVPDIINMPDIQMVDLDEGIDVSHGLDEEGNGRFRHVEHVKPRPLRPKPLEMTEATGEWDIRSDWKADPDAPPPADGAGHPW